MSIDLRCGSPKQPQTSVTTGKQSPLNNLNNEKLSPIFRNSPKNQLFKAFKDSSKNKSGSKERKKMIHSI